MKILALETSTEYCSAALSHDDTIIAKDTLAGQKHSEILLVMIQELLAEAELTLRQIDGIAFGAGPGSFTGLRIACGVAQGLGFAAKLPVVGISTLEALAQKISAPETIVALDARMGEIYHAAYQKTSEHHWEVISPPVLCSPDSPPALPNGNWVAGGSGFDVYRDKLSAIYRENIQQIYCGLHPQAVEIAQLARYKLSKNSNSDPANATPVYLRNKVALKEAERKS